jgi:quercetin dioxygenase-like cupin family protein
MAASLHFARGEAKLTQGEDIQEVKTGAFVHIPPQLQNSILSRTSGVMILTRQL